MKNYFLTVDNYINLVEQQSLENERELKILKKIIKESEKEFKTIFESIVFKAYHIRYNVFEKIFKDDSLKKLQEYIGGDTTYIGLDKFLNKNDINYKRSFYVNTYIYTVNNKTLAMLPEELC